MLMLAQPCHWRSETLQTFRSGKLHVAFKSSKHSCTVLSKHLQSQCWQLTYGQTSTFKLQVIDQGQLG